MLSTDKVIYRFDIFVDSLLNFQLSDYMRPLYTLNDVWLERVNQQTNCQTNLKSKQLLTRLSTFSGFFNVFFTAGYGYLMKNDLYASIENVINAASYGDLGLNLGKISAQLLDTYTQDNVYVTEVSKTNENRVQTAWEQIFWWFLFDYIA